MSEFVYGDRPQLRVSFDTVGGGIQLETPGYKASGTLSSLKTLNTADFNIFYDLFSICLKIIDF